MKRLRKDDKVADVETEAPDHVRGHPVFAGHTFGIMSAENPRFPVKVKGESKALESHLDKMGLRYERTVGQYDSPENSYIIHGPTVDQMHHLGHLFGQESVIHSQGGQHRLHYTHGPSAGHFVGHHAETPISYFKNRPSNFWTAMPGDTGFFRLNLDPEWKLQQHQPAVKSEFAGVFASLTKADPLKVPGEQMARYQAKAKPPKQGFRPGAAATQQTGADMRALPPEHQVQLDQMMEQGFQPETPPAMESPDHRPYHTTGYATAAAHKRANLAARSKPGNVDSDKPVSSMEDPDHWDAVSEWALQSASTIPEIVDPSDPSRRLHFKWQESAPSEKAPYTRALDVWSRPVDHTGKPTWIDSRWRGHYPLHPEGKVDIDRVHGAESAGGWANEIIDHIHNHTQNTETWKSEPIFGDKGFNREMNSMANKRSIVDLKKALADRLKKAEADFAELGRRESRLVKSEPVDPNMARAESTVMKMSEQDKQVLADRHGFSHRWHRDVKKSEAGPADSQVYRKSRDLALAEHFAKSYASADALGKAGHMEPGVHENATPGAPAHAEPGGHEQMSMPMPDNMPTSPVGSSAGIPPGDLTAPAQDMPVGPAGDPQGDLQGAQRTQGDLGSCPLCGQPDMPGSCTCLATQHGQPLALSEEMVKDEEDAVPGPSCPMCHGPGQMLGSLGNKEHFMCRNCGVGFHREAQPEPAPQGQPILKGEPSRGSAAGPGYHRSPSHTDADASAEHYTWLKDQGYHEAAAKQAAQHKEKHGKELGKNALMGYGADSAAPGPSMTMSEPTAKAEMCKNCGKSHEMEKCGDGLQVKPGKQMGKADDYVDNAGKLKTVGVADKAKLPPKGADNAGPGLDGDASKEMSAGGSGGDPKKMVKEECAPEKKRKLVVQTVGTVAPTMGAPLAAAAKAEPPMAKPPSGKNPGTAVPVAKPKAPKVGGAPGAPAGAPMGKAALPAQAKQHSLVDSSRAGAASAVPAPKTAMPNAAQHADRAQAFHSAAAGAFQPSGPVSSGLELAPKKPAGMSAPPAGQRAPAAGIKKPGFGKSETALKKADLGNCALCSKPEHTGACR